jgi:aspartyl-tRNA(Asn)/glutamyl-tRNA(Gln) amidotransferase subunit B
MSWEPVIGLEIHTQLTTNSKIFSGAPITFGGAPNTQACAIDLGLPGVLPVLNAQVVDYALRFGLAIAAHIAPQTVFARKNYFYPDLPKGYQISQYEQPIVGMGAIDILLDDGQIKTIGITRAHLEEDAGKSIHDDTLVGSASSGIDLNRAGTPLLEIVSEPDLRSPAEAVAYARTIHQLVRWIGISDGNMQEGSFRVDANISLRASGTTLLGTRTEIKNINSFRFLLRALEFEIERQAELLDAGQVIVQETRLYDAVRDETRAMRSKEEANDYRYFPDPDLLPVMIAETQIEAARAALPELPTVMRQRFLDEYQLANDDVAMLTSDYATARYFETVALTCQNAKLAANWLIGAVAAALNKSGADIQSSPVSAEELGALLGFIQDGQLSNKLAKQVFDAMWDSGRTAAEIIAEQGLQKISDEQVLDALIREVIAEHPQQVAQYRAGKDKLLGFFVGQIMKRTQGTADPKTLNALLLAALQNADG